MRSDPKELDGQHFDFVVVGGGIQGAALSRELALRGRRVLLVEKNDFGWATSSRSSRLIHGGLRYLEQGRLGLVREALQERERLLRLAPHLCRPLPMLMPHFAGEGRSPWVLRAGLWLYTVLARGSSLPRPRRLGAADCLRQFPGLRQQGLRGGSLFYDARTEDQRLCQAVVETAVADGARVANHLEVIGLDGTALRCRDHLTEDEISLSCGQILNAAGVGVDALRRCLGIDAGPLIRLSRGSHLLLPPRRSETALCAFLPDRRIHFVIPHQDATLCGTTEVEVEPVPSEPCGVPAADRDYLLQALGGLLEDPPGVEAVLSGYAGWRALPRGDVGAGRQSREALLVREESPAGPVHSVLGGKLTTHRSFAERVVQRLLGEGSPSVSRDRALIGGGKPQDFADPLWWRHGSSCLRLWAQIADQPELGERLCPHRPFLRVELRHALEVQGAMSLADALQRRLFHSLGPCMEPDCLAAALALYEHFKRPGAAAADATQLAALRRARVEELGVCAGPDQPA